MGLLLYRIFFQPIPFLLALSLRLQLRRLVGFLREEPIHSGATSLPIGFSKPNFDA